jgi:hypothetical protein
VLRQGLASCCKRDASPLILTRTSKPIANAVVQPRGVAAIRTSKNLAFFPCPADALASAVGRCRATPYPAPLRAKPDTTPYTEQPDPERDQRRD